jgi:dipeptidyl-peptidase-3
VPRAAFLGTRVTLRQVSPESESIFDLILDLAAKYGNDWDKLKEDAKVTADEVSGFLEYATQFLGNAGNYKGFGDSKFIPRISEASFKAIAATSPRAEEIYSIIGHLIWASKPDSLNYLGYTDEGHLTTYYPDSPDITKEEIKAIGEFCESKNFLLENTRLRKTKDGFEMLIASSSTKPPASAGTEEVIWKLPDGGVTAGKPLKLKYGDYSKQMADVAENLELAAKYAANDIQKKMLELFAASLKTGSLEEYKDGLRLWVKDLGPKLETNIGFVETYRDPHGVRGEMEGFVAMVNKERTAQFGKLVESAPSMIPKLPWSKDFEKDAFQSPDFTSLEVLSFAGSGIPA